MNWLAKSWQRLNDATIGKESYWTIAVQNYSIYRDTCPLIGRHIGGNTLDVGAGNLAWKQALQTRCASYVSSDFTIVNQQLDLVFDVTRPFPLKSGSFDSLFCHSVLEHTVRPWDAFAELHRVLDDGGTLLLSVPFIFYLHGAPFDFFRFTRHGITRLAEDAGFRVESLVLNGGMFHFILNMPSVIISSLFFSLHCAFLIPIVTKLLSACARFLDSKLDKAGIFAMNIVCVLKKD